MLCRLMSELRKEKTENSRSMKIVLRFTCNGEERDHYMRSTGCVVCD